MKIHFVIDMDRPTSDFCPHLGVAYLSAYIKKNVSDAMVFLSFMTDDVVADIVLSKPDVVAFSSTSRFFGKMNAIAASVTEKTDIPKNMGRGYIFLLPRKICLNL